MNRENSIFSVEYVAFSWQIKSEYFSSKTENELSTKTGG